METRQIRSYVLRQGRMTDAQRISFSRYWKIFGVEPVGEINPEECFSRAAPLTVEVGFGMGDSLLAMAKAEAGRNFLGLEVHSPGIGNLLRGISISEIKNLRLMKIDALAVLEKHLPKKSVNRLQIFFPDPWPKKKHKKRRLINTGFLDLVARVLEQYGLIHIATDWEDYAYQIKDTFFKDPRFSLVESPQRAETKYEKRGINNGHQIFDIAYRFYDLVE